LPNCRPAHRQRRARTPVNFSVESPLSGSSSRTPGKTAETLRGTGDIRLTVYQSTELTAKRVQYSSTVADRKMSDSAMQKKTTSRETSCSHRTTVIAMPSVHARASSARSTSCSGDSPQATVRQYYRAVVRHQASGAKSCLTSSFVKMSARFVDPDWSNVASVRSLHLRSYPIPPRGLPGLPTKVLPYAAAQVVADFVVRYYHVIDSPDGKTTRFIYVVKQHRSAPWRIASIGSGP
jgi:hypothetical protein